MRVSIRTEILVFFVIISAFVMILTGTLLFGAYKNNLTEQFESESRYAMEENRDSFNKLVHQFELGGSYVANSRVIAELLTEEMVDELRQDTTIAILSNEIQSIYNLTLDSVLDNYSVSFFVNGDIHWSRRLLKGSERGLESNNRISLYSLSGMEELPWVRECIEEYGGFYCLRLDTESSYVYFAKAIYSSERILSDSSFLGISVVGFDTRQLINRFERMRAASDMSFLIVDRNGKMLSESHDIPKKLAKHTIEKPDFNSAVPGRVIKEEGYIIQIEKTDIGFTILSFLAQDDIYMKTKDIQRFWFFVIIVVFVLIVLCSYCVSRHLARPIQELSYHMKNYEGTELEKMSVKSFASIELDYLYEAFNELTDKISKLMLEIEQKNIISKDLEMSMFQLQINPHFLYNTLDSIAWRSMSNGQNEVADMIGSLSKIFHYSVKNGNLSADLCDEIDIVKEYVSLQKKRYDNEITVETEIPEVCRRFKVPRCILQPIVENAIIHGNEGRNEALKIEISAQMTEQ